MSDLLLAVDTTHEFGSLALLRGGCTVEEVLLHAPDGFGHVLYAQLERLFQRHAIRADHVACFAAASGPGSFTGVRIGLACVKGLAEAAQRPAAAVANLQAMAQFGSAPLRAVVLDARRGEVYGAVYDASGRPVVPETVCPFQAWLASLPEGELEFIGLNFEPFRAALSGTRFEHCAVVDAPRAIAAAVGRIAWLRFLAGEACDPAAIDANYVRRSDAELSLGKAGKRP